MQGVERPEGSHSAIQPSQCDVVRTPPPSHCTESVGNDVRRVEELDESSKADSALHLEKLSIPSNSKPVVRSDPESQNEAGQTRSQQEAEPSKKSSTATLASYHIFSIHILSVLMSFSVFGTLARLGIHALASYPGQSIFPLAWVQAVGCLIMGFTVALREPITTFYNPLYIAITTGFCGSLTTFSGWQLDVFQAWSNTSGPPKLWVYNVMDGLTRLLFTLAISLASFDLGVNLGKRLISRLSDLSPPTSSARWILTLLSMALYVLTIPFFVHLNHSWRPLATAAIMFSFTGTFSRYVLSTQLNPRLKTFPLGTLLANEIATTILGMCHIIQRDPSPPSPVPCSILQGFIDGYCGCMSTVSTFAYEVRTLKGKKAWRYVAVSLGLGQAILLVMLGPAWWSGHIHDNNICKAK